MAVPIRIGMQDTKGIGRVYCLRDPRDKARRYVGETTQLLLTRVGWHVGHALSLGGNLDGRTRNEEFTAWVQELSALGLMPLIELLEEVPMTGDERVDKRIRWDREQHWKGVLIAEGCSLLNKTCGVPRGHVFADGTGARKLRGRKRPELAAKLAAREQTSEDLAKLERARATRWAKYRALSPQELEEDHRRRQEAAARAWATRRANRAAKSVPPAE